MTLPLAEITAIAHAIANRLQRLLPATCLEYEDLIAVARISAWNACRSWSPDRQVKLSTWAYTQAYRRCQLALDHASAWGRNAVENGRRDMKRGRVPKAPHMLHWGDLEAGSLDCLGLCAPDDTATAALANLWRAEFRRDLRRALAKLTPRARRHFEARYLQKRAWLDIAAAEGESRNTAIEQGKRACAQIAQLLADHGD